jgi:hypothetical protein
MEVGYRRCSGRIGLTKLESGTRGAWVEKRIAIWKSMCSMGHNVFSLSNTTDITSLDGVNKQDKKCDLLMLEFGGTNLQFYKKDWDNTIDVIKRHEGKIAFICDDPDLTMLWELLPAEDWTRWTVVANATNVTEVARVLKVPKGVNVIDMPMASGIPINEFTDGVNPVVYIGRNGGRTKILKEFTQSNSLIIAGKQNEWTKFPNVKLVDIPQQRDRVNFYRTYKGCLALFDNKHAITGWRTGRAYHALFAGIPILSPRGNDGLDWTEEVNLSTQLDSFVSLSKTQREDIWYKQIQKVRNMTSTNALKLLGL